MSTPLNKNARGDSDGRGSVWSTFAGGARSGAALLALLAGLATPIGIVTAEESAETHHSEHSFHEPFHTVGVFVGDTSEDRRSESGVTLGLEYEYRATERYGIGLTAERVAGDFDTDVFVLPVAVHHGPWKFYAGPGFETGPEGDEGLLRVGIEYGFRLGKYELSPQIDLDFVEGDRLFIFGLVLAREL